MSTPVTLEHPPPSSHSIPGKVETSLRSLQDDLKILRKLQLDAQKDTSNKPIKPKSFTSIAKKLYRNLVKLRTVLQEQCSKSPIKTNPFLQKDGELPRLQQPAEKLLRGLIERLGSYASHGGFTLTKPIYTTVADCLQLIYTHGSTRTLLDSMSKWEELLNSKDTTLPTRIALFHCAETLFVSLGKSLVSYVEPFLNSATKQFKMVTGTDVGSVSVRSSAIRCVGRALDAVGKSGCRHHTAALKIVVRAAADRSIEVRRAAAGALASVAQSAYEWADFNPEKGSVTVDQLLVVASKGLDQSQNCHDGQLAFGRVVGYILSLAIVHVKNESSGSDTQNGSNGGKTSNGSADTSMGDTPAKPKKTRGGFASMASSLGMKSTKKEATKYTVALAFDYLKSRFIKPASIRRQHIGSAHAVVTLLRSGVVFEGDAVSTKQWNDVIDGVLSLSVLTNGNEIPSSRLRPLLMVLEHGVVGSGRGEQDLQQLLRSALIRLLRNLKALKKASSLSSSVSASTTISLLNSTQIVTLLIVVARCTAALGDAALSVCVAPLIRRGGKVASVGLVDILYAFSSTPSRLVRTEVASCCRTLMCALPTLGVSLLNDFMSAMAKDHGDLVGLAATSRKKRPTTQERDAATRILLSLRGRSMAVAGLLYALPSCILGVPHSTSSEVLYLGTAFLHHHSDGMLIPSASSACAAAGWMMISGLFAGMGISALQPHFASLFQVFEEVFPAGAAPRSLYVTGGDKKALQHELEAINAASTALLHLMRSWPTMHEERPDLMTKCAACILNLVSSLGSPDVSLKIVKEGGATDDAKESEGGGTTLTSHVLFLTIHASTMEMSSLLPLDPTFLNDSFPRFAASFPALLASTSRVLAHGTYGETTLLATHCLLDGRDGVLQTGSLQWQSCSHAGPTSHSVSFGGESVECDALRNGIASTWGGSSGGTGGKSLARGVLTETEQEIATIEAMLWTAPIIADGSGGDNTAEYPRRKGVHLSDIMPWNVQPVPSTMERLSDAAVSLFGRIFPYQNTNQRHRLLTQLIAALKTTQPNKTSDVNDPSHSTVASRSARNIVAALLCAVRHLRAGIPELVAYGPGERRPNSGSVDDVMTLIPDVSAVDTKETKGGNDDVQWMMTFRAILKSALSSNDALVRRASAAAMGCLTSTVGGMFTRKVLRSLVSGLKGKHPSPSLRAGTAFALACHYRSTTFSIMDSDSVGDAGSLAGFNSSSSSGGNDTRRNNNNNSGAINSDLPELDAVLYDLARETREPVRTSALHSWWVLIRGHADINVANKQDVEISTLLKYVKPTLALVDAHLLTPPIGASRSEGVTDELDYLTFPDKDRTHVGRKVHGGVLTILGRLINALLSGIGEHLKVWVKESSTSQRHFSLMCATWYHLIRSPEESVLLEALEFIRILAKNCPQVILSDSRFATMVTPWVDGLLRGDDDEEDIGTAKSSTTLSSISDTSTTMYACQPNVRHSACVQRAALQILCAMSKSSPKIAMLTVRRLFAVLDRERTAMDVARKSPQSLPFGGNGGGSGGGSGGSNGNNGSSGSSGRGGNGSGISNGSGNRSVSTMENVGASSSTANGDSSPAECVPTYVPPLIGLQGNGLLSIHAAYGDSNGNSGLSLPEECRKMLLDLSVSGGHGSEWITALLSTCEDVVFSKTGNSDGAGDEDEDDEDEDRSSYNDNDIVLDVVDMLAAPGSSVLVDSMSSSTIWPLERPPRWQTRMIAMESVQRLLRASSHSGNENESDMIQWSKYLKRLVRLACFSTTSTSSDSGSAFPSPLGRFQTLGMTMIRDIVETFGDTQENQSVDENNKGEHSSGSSGGQSVLLLYEAQLSAAMRSAFEDKGGDDDDGDVMATVLKDKEDLLDNIPLALHASAPMAAMLSTGISQDTVVARRTIKTLFSGDSGTSKKNASDENALTSPPKPPKSFGHQEYVGTCLLAARLAALAELQLSTVDQSVYAWWSSKSIVSTSTNVHEKMRNSISKSLHPHLPILMEYWQSMLRDQVSLRARARAVRARRSSVSNTMYVLPAPRNSLLEHNEDSGQALPIFDTLWPSVVQAVASLCGTDKWDNSGTSLHLVLGVCLRYVSNGPNSIRGMAALLLSRNLSTSQNATLLPVGMRCLYAIQWCMSKAIVSASECKHVAVDLIKALSSGMGSPDNISSDHALSGRLASLLMISSILKDAAAPANVKRRKKLKKKMEKSDGDENKNMIRPLDVLLLDMQEEERALPDHGIGHSLLEWATKSIQTDIPSVTVPVGSSAASVRGLTARRSSTTSVPEISITSDQLLVASAAIDLIGLVIKHAHTDVIENYGADVMALYLRCLRALTQRSMWFSTTATEAAAAAAVAPPATAATTTTEIGRKAFVKSLRNLQEILFVHDSLNVSDVQGIVQRILSDDTSTVQGVEIVFSITTSLLWRKGTLSSVLSMTSKVSDAARNGIFLFVKSLLLERESWRLEDEEQTSILAWIGPMAVDVVYDESNVDVSSTALTLIGCAVGRDPENLLTPFLSLLCDTCFFNGNDTDLKQLVLSILRSNGGAFKTSVQSFTAEQQNILQEFIKMSMSMSVVENKSTRNNNGRDTEKKEKKQKKKKSKKKKLKL